MNKKLILGALALSLFGTTALEISQAQARPMTAKWEQEKRERERREQQRREQQRRDEQRRREQQRRQSYRDRRDDRRQDRRQAASYDRLADRVEDILNRDSILRRYRLNASANSSYITVSGRVHTYAERDRALGLARLSSNGVSVRSSIRVS